MPTRAVEVRTLTLAGVEFKDFFYRARLISSMQTDDTLEVQLKEDVSTLTREGYVPRNTGQLPNKDTGEGAGLNLTQRLNMVSMTEKMSITFGYKNGPAVSSFGMHISSIRYQHTTGGIIAHISATERGHYLKKRRGIVDYNNALGAPTGTTQNNNQANAQTNTEPQPVSILRIYQYIANTNELILDFQTEEFERSGVTTLEGLKQAGRTDKEILDYLTQRIANGLYVWYINKGVLYVGPRRYDSDCRTTYILSKGASFLEASFWQNIMQRTGGGQRATSLGNGSGFSARPPEAEVPETATNQEYVRFDLNNDRNYTETAFQVREEDLGQTASGDNEQANQSDGTAGVQKGTGSYVYGGEDDPRILRNKALHAIWTEASKAIQGRVKVVGNPSIGINEVLAVSGFPERFNGNWLTQEVQHELSVGGGFTSTINLSKNSVNEAVPEISTIGRTGNINATRGPAQEEETDNPREGVQITFRERERATERSVELP